MIRSGKRTVINVAVVAALVAGLLAIATAAGIIRWRVPDQSAMTKYLKANPFDSYPELSDRQIHDDGTNHHVCFMCSTYGITMAYELVEIDTKSEQDAFCDRVAETISVWHGGSEAQYGLRENTCVFTVPLMRDHDSWTLVVVVAFLPDVHYPVNEPPHLLFGIDDYTV